jgi:hypothetical protein
MASTRLLHEIGTVIEKEEELSLQCMWQHYLLQGAEAETISSILMQLAINESMRVEIITRTLGCLKQPRRKKREIRFAERTLNPVDMLRGCRDCVDEIIASYKHILTLFREGERECLLKESFEELLAQQKKHRAMLEDLLAVSAGGTSPIAPNGGGYVAGSGKERGEVP